ncbi:EAL domain-containing response regulator [Cellvibrio sp. OA-2007]|uniref:EAL domain-containing response regulator n=1 Tax=Cellvibrio sp. OA-2007 TaxID=529823 RepID=UPI0007813CEA|nr:EAL domain-containing response regulator [Cellvibrio sp. OA-2007]
MISLNTSINETPLLNLHSDIQQQGVMVVDDSSMHRYSAHLCLRTFGINQVYEAANGKLAIEQLAQLTQMPAVMLLDLEMPVMDGIEVLQQLAQLQHKPAVVLASSSDEVLISAVATMAEALGISLLGAFRKPVNPVDLADALNSYNTGGGPLTHFNRPIDTDAEQLKIALDRATIQVYYQPKIDLESMKIAGVEALARWKNQQGDWIPPSVFIPLAEEHGLIGDLTLSVLEQVLQDMNGWWEQGQYVPVAINLSAKSLAEFNLANEIIQRVIRQGIPANFLTFEITESALVMDLPSALATISRLRLKGFGISIDDYGTGFSSMQQLSRFPFSELKIDRSFIQGAPGRQYIRNILKSAIEMGQRLGITTVAEGVETEAELHLLKSLGCKQAQGFLLARPMPGRELMGWIEQELQPKQTICQKSLG